jgi:hypothetical protein
MRPARHWPPLSCRHLLTPRPAEPGARRAFSERPAVAIVGREVMIRAWNVLGCVDRTDADVLLAEVREAGPHDPDHDL